MKRTQTYDNFGAYEMNRIAKTHNERAPQRRFESALEHIHRAASNGLFCARFGLKQICPYTTKKLEAMHYKIEQTVEPSDDDDKVNVDIVIVRW